MLTVYSEDHALQDGQAELVDGRLVPCFEMPRRAFLIRDRVLAVDTRSGTATPDLWPPGSRPAVEEVHDVDDWLAIIATGRCVGVTAESTLSQYPPARCRFPPPPGCPVGFHNSAQARELR